MKRAASVLLILLAGLLALMAGPGSVQPVQAQDERITGGAAFHSIPPRVVCVGDRFTFEAGASTDWPDSPLTEGFPYRLPALPITNVRMTALQGTVSPDHLEHLGDNIEFAFTYTAQRAGTETVTINVNNGLASTIERFEVREHCDYDVYLMTVMHMTIDIGDGPYQYLAHVVGSGILKRDRQGSQFLQGDGNWHLQNVALTKPSMCVEWNMPPVLLNGPLELDGRLDDEGSSLDVKVSFMPANGPPVFHGISTCVDENGDVVEGWSTAQGGNQGLASQINSTFSLDGGSQQVALEGKGLEMVQAQSQLDYQAVLTLIPRGSQ